MLLSRRVFLSIRRFLLVGMRARGLLAKGGDLVDHTHNVHSQRGLAAIFDEDRAEEALLRQIRRRRPLARRLVKVSLSCVFGSLLLIVLAAGAFIFYLDRAPIVISSLSPQIEQALDERLGHGYKFHVGNVAIANSAFGPTLTVDHLQLRGANGETIFESVRGAEISVDPLALLGGRVVPRRLDVADVELRLVLLPDGSLAVSAGSGAKATLALWHPLASAPQDANQSAQTTQVTAAAVPQVTPPPAVDPTAKGSPQRALLVKHIGAVLRLIVDDVTNPDSPIAAIDRLGLAHGKLVIEDRMTDRSKIYDDLNFAFDKSSGETRVKLAAIGPNGRWAVTAKSQGKPGQARSLEIALQNFSLDELSLIAGLRSVGVDFDMPLASKFTLNVAPDGNLTEIAGSLSMGSGYLRLDDPDDEPKFIDSIEASFHWDRALRRIALDNAQLIAGKTNFAFTGSIAAPVNQGDAWTIDFANAAKVVVGPELPGDEPIEIEKFALQGKLDVDGKTLQIDRFAFSGPQCGFAMAGAIDWKAGPHMRIGASIDPTPARVAIRLWPSFLIADVRNWFLYHWKEGVVQSAHMQLDLNAEMIQTMRMQHAPPDDATKLDFTIVNGTVDFFPGVPPIRNLAGEGHITGRTSNFVATGGTLDAGGRRLMMSEGSFRIADADAKPTPAEISAKVTGSVEAVGDLLSRDALKPYANLPIEATTMKGQIDGRLTIGMKLGPGGGRPEDTTFKSNAIVTNFAAEKVVGNEKLDNATLSVTVDAAGMRANGQGRIFNGPATIDLFKPVDKPGNATISVVLDDAARAKQGLTAFSNVTGPITAHITAPLAMQEPIKAQVEIDLVRANVEIAPGVVKPAGKAGKAIFALTIDQGKTQLDQIQFDAPPALARGTVEISADQSNITARFSQVKLSPGDEMRVDLTKTGDTMKFIVHGSVIDARPFLKFLTVARPEAGETTASVREANAGRDRDRDKDKDKDSAAKDIDLDLKSAVLTGFNKQALSNVDLRFAKRGDHLRQFALSGRFGRTPVVGTLSSAGAPAPQLNVSTEDAGSLLSFVDLYRHMEGGELDVSMRMGEDAVAGVLDLKDFTLRGEPALRRLAAEGGQQLSQGSSRLGQGPTSLDVDAARFKRLHVNFQRVGSRLDLREGRMNGDSVGLTVDGWLDFSRDKVNLDGTFLPVFALNNIPSQIPVFGLLLGGGAHEGMFGVNYHISGSVASPVVNYNIISAIAPGIFRKIFGATDGSEFNSPGTSSIMRSTIR